MPSKFLAIGILLASCLFGVRMTMLLGFHNGMFGVIGAALSSPALQTPTSSAATVSAVPFPAGPQPFIVQYSGLAPVDRLLSDVIGYFTLLMHTPQDWGSRAAWMYLMVQFYGIWQVVQLEGYRVGNANRAIRHTAILGLIFQVASLAFTLPLYLIIHILTSPTATMPGALRVPHADHVVTPLAGFLAFTLPAVGMGLPGMLKAPMYYYVSALWQVFPATQAVWHFLCRRGFLSEGVTGGGVDPVPIHVEEIEDTEDTEELEHTEQVIKTEQEVIITATTSTTVTTAAPQPSVSQSLPTAYRDAFRQGVTSQLLLLSLLLLSPETPYLPAALRRAAMQITWSAVFTPLTFHSSPIIDSSLLEAHAAGASTQAPLLGTMALTFLQWDLLCSSISYLTWAVYESLKGGREDKQANFFETMRVVVGWGLLGGPAAAGAVLLSKRDRDNVALTWDGDEKTDPKVDDQARELQG